MPFESEQQKKFAGLLVSSIINSKSKWMDSVMSKVLPDDVYGWSKSGENTDRMRLSRWMAKNGVEMKEGDGFTQITIGEAFVSEWKWRIENSKLEQTIRTIGRNDLAFLKETLTT